MNSTQAWNFALGLIKIDDLEPSHEFLELVEKEKRGEITTEDMKEILDRKYRIKSSKEVMPQ